MRVALDSWGNRDGRDASTRAQKKTNTAMPDVLASIYLLLVRHTSPCALRGDCPSSWYSSAIARSASKWQAPHHQSQST